MKSSREFQSVEWVLCLLSALLILSNGGCSATGKGGLGKLLITGGGSVRDVRDQLVDTISASGAKVAEDVSFQTEVELGNVANRLDNKIDAVGSSVQSVVNDAWAMVAMLFGCLLIALGVPGSVAIVYLVKVRRDVRRITNGGQARAPPARK